MLDDDHSMSTLRAVAEQLAGTLSGIEADQWSLRTPCDDWQLGDLIDHVTGGNWFTVEILGGAPSADALERTKARFGELAQARAGAVEAVAELVESFEQPHVLDRTIDHIAGPLTGRQALRLRLQDLIVHVWDVEQSVSPPTTIQPRFVEWGWAELGDDQSLTAEHFGLTAVGDTSSGEPTEARYLAVFGR